MPLSELADQEDGSAGTGEGVYLGYGLHLPARERLGAAPPGDHP